MRNGNVHGVALRAGVSLAHAQTVEMELAPTFATMPLETRPRPGGQLRRYCRSGDAAMSGAPQIVKATHAEAATLCRKNDIKRNFSYPVMVLALACGASVFVHAGVEVALAQTKQIEESMSPNGDVQMLDLSTAQKSAIYEEVRKNRSKAAPIRFDAHPGAEVPPMIALYPLPDAILDNDPVTKLYQFTIEENQVVLVDPTKMLVVAVIGPKPGE
jgi:uncharacterized protein DUF1236